LPRTLVWSIFLRSWGNFVAGLRPEFGLFCDMSLWFPLAKDTVSMEGVNLPRSYYTRFLQTWLIAVAACALSGCWEEIHYTAPPPSATPAVASVPTETAVEPAIEQSPVATTHQLPTTDAADFGDDLAATLANTEPATATGPIGETASAVGDSPPPITEDRYTDDPSSSSTSDTSVEAPARPAASRSPRRIAWLLGSNLSLAALANDRVAAPEKVADWFDKSQRLAKLLGTSVDELPPRPADGNPIPNADHAIDYLFAHGATIGRFAAKQYGDDHAALFELAVKSNILLVLYQPGAPVVKSLTVAIEQSGERAGLPVDLLQPLIQLLDTGATPKEVRDAVFEFHANVDRHLSSTTQ
jgi:hypothetical protein